MCDMAISELRLIKNSVEYLPQKDVNRIPKLTRGIYVLYKHWHKAGMYDVVYVGMAGGEVKSGIGGRLRSHRRTKGKYWTHFSAYEVWDNIREEEVRELEGILRHIYRKDKRANSLAKQKSFHKLTRIRRESKKENWLKQSTPTLPGQ